MSLFRWIVGMPMAALVTAGLFFLMAQLIRDQQLRVEPPQESPNIKITAKLIETDPRQITPPREVIPEKTPETIIDFPTPTGPNPQPAPGPGKIDIDRTPPGTDTLLGATIIIPPPYPENCRSRGVEGVVVVQFDVTPEGNVVNARIIDTPHACFVRTVLKAVSGWKYPPAASGGMRYGVVEHFSFQLTE